jgi:hypothetical protein
MIPMPRPQFTLRALLLAMLVVAAFFGGVRFERERRRRADAKNTEPDFRYFMGYTSTILTEDDLK